MNAEYVPTLGEYAAVIEWLIERGANTATNEPWSGWSGAAKQMDEEMRPALWDAMDRSSMRRFARWWSTGTAGADGK